MFDEIDFLFDEINNTLNKENKNSRLIYHSNSMFYKPKYQLLSCLRLFKSWSFLKKSSWKDSSVKFKTFCFFIFMFYSNLFGKNHFTIEKILLYWIRHYNIFILMVDIESNPLYYAAIGGLIIGIATSINYMLRGNVTGMSGMLYSTITLDKSIHYVKK